MRWSALTLILITSLGFAASNCPDPKQRQAAIRGDRILGVVTLHKTPLKFSHVRLRLSSGKTAWDGTTDENGGFVTSIMPPGEYRLDVSGWGSTTIQLGPEPDNRMGRKIPLWGLILSDNACVGTIVTY